MTDDSLMGRIQVDNERSLDWWTSREGWGHRQRVAERGIPRYWVILNEVLTRKWTAPQEIVFIPLKLVTGCPSKISTCVCPLWGYIEDIYNYIHAHHW